MKKVIYLVACILMFVVACKKDKATPETTTSPATTTTGKVTYNGDIKSIMTAKCATPGCHTAGSQTPYLTNYSTVKVYVPSILARMNLSVSDGAFMPQLQPKVQADIDKITQWNTDGLLEQ